VALGTLIRCGSPRIRPRWSWLTSEASPCGLTAVGRGAIDPIIALARRKRLYAEHDADRVRPSAGQVFRNVDSGLTNVLLLADVQPRTIAPTTSEVRRLIGDRHPDFIRALPAPEDVQDVTTRANLDTLLRLAAVIMGVWTPSEILDFGPWTPKLRGEFDHLLWDKVIQSYIILIAHDKVHRDDDHRLAKHTSEVLPDSSRGAGRMFLTKM
jgi:hypothetical protein